MRASARHRGGLVGAAVVAVGVAAIVAVNQGGSDRSTDRRTPGPAADKQERRPPSPAGSGERGGGLRWRTPVTAVLPGTPVQQQTTQAFIEGVSRQPGMAAAAALRVPAPGISGGWPALPVELTPEGWARQFVKGLLDIDYATRSRAALGPWLQAQEAPALIPGIPESVADKMLYTSLLATEVFGGQPTPIPSAAEWEAKARAGARQWVDDLQVHVNPRWAQLIATGWQPPDARMTILDVAGLLTVRRPDAVSTNPFALHLVVGSARWHDGYGTVSVFGWRLEVA